MRINHNITALNTYRQLSTNTAETAKNIEKLSSGLRINRAGDDAAGLAISEKMRGQIRGLDQASRNGQDAISMIQTAEGALNETHSILQRMRELANQSANGTNTDFDRKAIQDEVNQLTSEINRIGNTTEFNTQKLLNGGMSSADGVKSTAATAATKTLADNISTGAAWTFAAGDKIVVDNQTFNLAGSAVDGKTFATAADAVEALKELTSGGVKLSDVADISETAGQLTIKSKSVGTSSNVDIVAAAATIGTAAVTSAQVTGTPSTIERAGLESAATLKGGTVTINAGDTLKISVDGGAAVDVKFDSNKVYADTDAGRTDLVKDLNAALQKAGLDGQVSASLASDGKLQLISETGKDLSVAGSTAGLLGELDMALSAPTNVQQVVGPGAQGSGFTTTFQIGANAGQSMALTVNDMRAAALKITGNAGQSGFTATNAVTNGTTDIKAEAALNVSTKEFASKSITVIENAIRSVSDERGKLGAVQNRLEHTIANLNTSSENLTAAESRIRDVDMAKEMMAQTKNNILAQAAQAMLAQANQQPQGVLQLLRG